MKLRRGRATASLVGPCTPHSRVWRTAHVALFAFLSAYLFVIIGFQQLAASSAWITGDWLINYSNGFVRRGLIGEISRQLYYAAGLDPISVLVAIKALLYTTLCASLLMLA